MAAPMDQPASAQTVTSVYDQLDKYDWDSDAEFQSGLSAIMSSATSVEQREELSLRARCFYFARKYGTKVDYDAYKAYRDEKAKIESTEVFGQVNGAIGADPTAPEPGPKLSYQEIVDLIQSGKPVPGIKEIPNTVLAGQGTSATASRRRKPWEKDVPATTDAPAPNEAPTEATA